MYSNPFWTRLKDYQFVELLEELTLLKNPMQKISGILWIKVQIEKKWINELTSKGRTSLHDVVNPCIICVANR